MRLEDGYDNEVVDAWTSSGDPAAEKKHRWMIIDHPHCVSVVGVERTDSERMR